MAKFLSGSQSNAISLDQILQNATKMGKSVYAEYASGPVNMTLVTMTTILSMIGSFTIIASYISWKDIRTTSRTVLLFVSIADFLIAISNIFGTFSLPHGNTPRDVTCVTQSFVTNSVSIMSFLWTATLALYLYMAIVKHNAAFGSKIVNWAHFFNWSVGPIINFIALEEGMLGDSAEELTGGWCWILHSEKPGSKDKEIIWMLLDAKLIELIVYGSILVLYILIKIKLHKELETSSKKSMAMDVFRAAKAADRKLVFIPILLILGRFWGTLRFLMFCADALPSGKEITVLPTVHKMLLTMQGIGDSCQGLLNCILFCLFNQKVYEHLKDFFCFYACFCKRSNTVTMKNDDASIMARSGMSLEDTSNFSDPSSPLLGAQFIKYG